MEMSGEQKISAPRQEVWAALNDPEILRQCIPGCRSLTKLGNDRMEAVAQIKVGPIGAKFTGMVNISELDPPNGYRITGEGQGGAAGSAKGSARVDLRDDGPNTLLTYKVDVDVGGRLAQLGGPIIQATAKQMAGSFFRQLSAVMGKSRVDASEKAAAPVSAETAVPSTPRVGPASAAPASAGNPILTVPGVMRRVPVVWVLTLVLAWLCGYLLGKEGDSGSGWVALGIGLLILVAGAAFQLGRTSSAPILVLDQEAAARLFAQTRRDAP